MKSNDSVSLWVTWIIRIATALCVPMFAILALYFFYLKNDAFVTTDVFNGLICLVTAAAAASVTESIIVR